MPHPSTKKGIMAVRTNPGCKSNFRIGGLSLNDVGPRLSKLMLVCTVLNADLHLAASIRTRGLRRSVLFFALGTGLPAAGELLATGPLELLRHRVRYRVARVPLAIILGWYAVIHGSFAVAGRVSERLHPGEDAKRKTVPALAALVGVVLDLILDPAGLDSGLWEWNVDGAYASEIRGANGRGGVPFVNYLGWIALVGGVVYVYGSVREDEEEELLPALLLLPYYLAGVGWALKRRRCGYLLLSAPFPVALYAALENR
jgi:uncharacterized membrane protein